MSLRENLAKKIYGWAYSVKNNEIDKEWEKDDINIKNDYLNTADFILTTECLELLKEKYKINNVGFNLLNNSHIVIKEK